MLHLGYAVQSDVISGILISVQMLVYYTDAGSAKGVFFSYNYM